MTKYEKLSLEESAATGINAIFITIIYAFISQPFVIYLFGAYLIYFLVTLSLSIKYDVWKHPVLKPYSAEYSRRRNYIRIFNVAAYGIAICYVIFLFSQTGSV